MNNEILNWLVLAYKFAADGDPKAMRACAREIFGIDDKAADGPAVMALAALYAGQTDEADILSDDAMTMDKHNFNARLARAGVLATRFALKDELDLLTKLIKDVTAAAKKERELQKELAIRLHMGRAMPTDEKILREATAAKSKIFAAVLLRANGFLADAAYLAADPVVAADALLKASELTPQKEDKAALYGKYLFMLNYRLGGSGEKKADLAKRYNDFFIDVPVYNHENVRRIADKKLRIGYISGDFRRHAVAYFLEPLLKEFNRDEFIIHCYSLNKADDVTANLRRQPVLWREMYGKAPAVVAKIIAEDHVDILVDLGGHSGETNALPIMAYRPAPIQMTALGYTATTGLKAIDYFLSDKICSPAGVRADNIGFTEKIIKMPGCAFCYAPGLVRQMPPAAARAPITDNGFVTFGSFNNFNKVSDELLHLWRSVLDRLTDSRLIIKGKVASTPSGREILTERLRKLSFDLSRVELRPFSQNYLEEYNDIDIALDTMPYNGGLTTCEALFMGVPTVTMRGKTHGSRIGASILTAAESTELVAQNQMEYVKKILQLASNPALIKRYHSGLRDYVRNSPLMDTKKYMAELQELYRQMWQDFCRGNKAQH